MTSQEGIFRRAPHVTHLSLATRFAGLLDLAPFHGHAILVRCDELDGPLLWGLSHGWAEKGQSDRSRTE